MEERARKGKPRSWKRVALVALITAGIGYLVLVGISIAFFDGTESGRMLADLLERLIPFGQLSPPTDN